MTYARQCLGTSFENEPCKLIRKNEAILCQKLHAHIRCLNKCQNKYCIPCYKNSIKNIRRKRGSKDITIPMSVDELKQLISQMGNKKGDLDLPMQALVCMLYLSGRRVSEIANKITKNQISVGYSEKGREYLTIRKVFILKKRDWYIVKEMKVINYDDFIKEGKKQKDWEEQMNISTRNGHIPQHIGNNNYSFCFTVKKPKKKKTLNEKDVELLPEEHGFFLDIIKEYLKTFQYEDKDTIIFPLNGNRAHKKIYEQTQGKLFPHYLRYLRVTYMFKLGVSESEIVQFMGWSSIAPLDTYKRLTKEDRLEMMMERLVKD